MTASSRRVRRCGTIVERRCCIHRRGIGSSPKQSLGNVEILIYLREDGRRACAADEGVMCGDRIERIGRACRSPNNILENQLQAAVFSSLLHRRVSGGVGWMESILRCEPQACGVANHVHPGLGGQPGLCNIESPSKFSHKRCRAKRRCSKASLLFMPMAKRCLIPEAQFQNSSSTHGCQTRGNN